MESDASDFGIRGRNLTQVILGFEVESDASEGAAIPFAGRPDLSPSVKGLGFRSQGVGCRVWGVGCGV